MSGYSGYSEEELVAHLTGLTRDFPDTIAGAAAEWALAKIDDLSSTRRALAEMERQHRVDVVKQQELERGKWAL